MLRSLPLTLAFVSSLCAQPSGGLRLAEGRFGTALDPRVTPVLMDGNERSRKPPLTVECWAKINSKKSFNVLVACESKASSQHWEIYSYAGSGAFSVYMPGMNPSEIDMNHVSDTVESRVSRGSQGARHRCDRAHAEKERWGCKLFDGKQPASMTAKVTATSPTADAPGIERGERTAHISFAPVAGLARTRTCLLTREGTPWLRCWKN